MLPLSLILAGLAPLMAAGGPAGTATNPIGAPNPSWEAAKHVEAILPSGLHPASGGESTLSVVPNDPMDFPNQGVETNITGFAPRNLAPLNAFQVAAEETIGAYDAVFGLFQNSSFGPIGFFEVFTATGDRSVHLAYGAPLATVPGLGYQFQLQQTRGTLWNLSVDGAQFASGSNASSFDFGTASATASPGLEFSEVAFYGSTPANVVPDTLVATTAIAVLGPNGWRLPTNATASFNGAVSGAWGAAGRAQAPALAPGEIRSGTSLPALRNGTTLWTGGPVPLFLALSLSSDRTTATLPVRANVTARDGSGTAIPQVPLAISDSRGGHSYGGGNETDGQGSAQLVLVTPNVSAAGTDVVSVYSTLLGYPGLSSAPLILTPALEVLLTASPGAPVVPINGTVTLTFRTSALGAAAPNTPIQFSSSLGGSLSVAYASSGPDGSLALAFRAGGAPAIVAIHAVVVAPGVWGGLTVKVQVVRPAPSLLTQAEPYAVVGVAALLGGIVYATVRRRRIAAVPELTFLSDARDPEPPSGPGDPPAPNRRPPSEGSP